MWAVLRSPAQISKIHLERGSRNSFGTAICSKVISANDTICLNHMAKRLAVCHCGVKYVRHPPRSPGYASSLPSRTHHEEVQESVNDLLHACQIMVWPSSEAGASVVVFGAAQDASPTQVPASAFLLLCSYS